MSSRKGWAGGQARRAFERRAGRGAGLGAAALALAAMAGCGGALAGGNGLRVEASAHAVRTGEQLRLAAIAGGTGEPAQVEWRITASDNARSLGAGTISAEGVYTPPGMLSRDVVTVTIAASGPGEGGPAGALPVITTLSITPGFVQPLQPENATVTPGSRLEVRAQLAEVGSGRVRWQIAGAGTGGQQLGGLSDERCERGSGQFTTCTVTYTAPPAGTAETQLWLVASAGGGDGPGTARARARIVVGGVTSDPATHQVEQRGPVALGGSGGNDNDFDTYTDRSGARFVADCCGGTLGALVEDRAGTAYILSNNHVLATSDQGHAGDTVEQPGLIDDGCVPLSRAGAQVHAVGALRYAVPLDKPLSNVDAAMASVLPGAVDASGAILELGEPVVNGPNGELRSAPPVAGTGELLDAGRLAGLSVVKSGRTTGLTCSTVDAVAMRVAVDYYLDCAESRPYTTKIFTGQIGIGGDGFADSGDSGSLVLDAANAEAVGLLYATATAGTAGPRGTGVERVGGGLSLAHPIGDVLSELGEQAGARLTLRGTSTPHRVACLDYGRGERPGWPTVSDLAPDERTHAAAAAEQASGLRVGNPRGVLAVAAGASEDEPGRGAVLVYVDRAQGEVRVPAAVAGVRTVVIPSEMATVARGPSAWPAPVARAGLRLSAAAMASGRATVDRVGPGLMQVPGVFGVGLGQSLDSPEEGALLVLLDTDAAGLETARRLATLAGEEAEAGAAPGELPAVLGGLRVRYLRMHRFHVTRSKYLAPGTVSSCSARQLLDTP